MIKYSGNTINDWNYGASNLIKVYRNGAVCYYKVTGGGDVPTAQTPCFAVVDDISQYSDTEFEDVFNLADEKWYKLNNLSQYEEYGIYGSGRTITTYEGKLTIDEDYEYEWNGSSWDNLGEISGGTIVPQGYTEVEYVENTSSAYLNLGVYPYSSSSNSYAIEAKFSSTQGSNQFEYLFSCEQGNLSPYVGFVARWQTTTPRGLLLDGTNYTSKNITNNQDGTSGFTITSNLTNATNTTPITLFCGLQGSTVWRNCKGKVYSFKVTINDNLVREMIPCKRDNDNMVGMYDIVNDVFYYPPNYTSYQLVAGAATGTTYPLYYDEKADPPNNLSFSSMTEAEEYECPWVGMKATIDGVKYVFSGDSQSGYEWVEDTNHYLPDVPFMLNYNAKNYNSSTYSIAKTEGQLKDVDAVCNYGYGIVDHSSDGYISVTSNTRMLLSGSTYLGRNNTQTGCTMTIVSKVKTSSGYSILTNRRNGGGYMNWMWRYPSNGIFLHGSTSYNNPLYFTTTTSTPIIASIKTYYDNGIKQQLNDWTNSGSYSGNFQYGTEYNGESSLFCDYTDNNSEFWQGDFYWVYMSQEVLTDEQIQQVIDYNENL